MARDDEIVVDATDINHEASSNLWCFSPDDEQPQGISAEALADFIGQVVAARQKQLSGDVPMLFLLLASTGTRHRPGSYASVLYPPRMAGCPSAAPSTLERSLHRLPQTLSKRTGSMPSGARPGRMTPVKSRL
ncbi:MULTISPECIES: hypothetical protein [Comamonas]|uniref:hypothetical protein n=1 Tax=Comamonas TaxID=283 RepID=UPI001E32EBD8|nr:MULTISPECIES: hypothetical protein [Comamonas]MDN5504210.1 hypothetical protein [Comamonas sp.]MDN5539956.1 hypothetical protein [Comamonas sp.]